jgi:hypothetical protein
MWYWSRPQFRGSAPITREGAWYLTKIFLLPMAVICLALKLVLIFVYHQSVLGSLPADIASIHLDLFGWYLLSSPIIWFVIFRWWMRRKNPGQHSHHSVSSDDGRTRYMTYRR